VNLLETLQLVALGVALAWKLNQLRRAPYDRALLIVTSCVAAAGLAFISQRRAAATFLDATLGPGSAKLAQNLLLFGVLYLLMAFFLYVNGDRTRLRRESIVLAVAAAALAAALLITPSAQRSQSYSVQLSTSVSMFYLVGELYLGYASIVTVIATSRYLRKIETRSAWGLRIMAVALTASFIFGPLTRTVDIVLHLVGTGLPRPIASAALSVLLGSIVLFLIGLTVTAVATRVAAWRRWRRHRRSHRLMQPLWVLLRAAFPQVVLPRAPKPTRWERLSPVDVHRRHYRRAIECRDGLVLISPWLPAAQPGDESDRHRGTAELARDLRRALRAHARGEPPVGPVRLLAPPARPDLDADVAELIALAANLCKPTYLVGETVSPTERKG
jgi:hypothetical protein